MMFDPSQFMDDAPGAPTTAAPRMLFLREGRFGDNGLHQLAVAPWKPGLIRAYLVFLALSRLSAGGPVTYEDVTNFGEFPSRQSTIWHLGRLVSLGAIQRTHVPLEGTSMYARVFTLSEWRLLRSLGFSEESIERLVASDEAAR